MDTTGITADNIRVLLKPLVTMIVAEVSPRRDELSKNQAYREYSRRWIDDQVRRGNLTVRYSGNRALVSRADIELLIAAEREKPTITTKQQ